MSSWQHKGQASHHLYNESKVTLFLALMVSSLCEVETYLVLGLGYPQPMLIPL